MSRYSTSTSQRQRTKENPLVLGTFSETSLRELHGSLGPENKVVGRVDTNQYSNGGFGGGTMNHWFQVNITSPAWIITRKGGPRPNYIEVSAFDLNKNPIEGRMIFQADSVSTSINGSEIFYPYIGHVMGAGSDLANNFNSYTVNKGNDLYFVLEAGSYLICVSSTRNEPLDYTLGLVVEFPALDSFILLEDLDGSFLVAETTLDFSNTIVIGPSFNVNYSIPVGFNAYTFSAAFIDSGVTVTIPTTSTWFIGFVSPETDDKFELEPSDSYTMDVEHEHSLTEWSDAWKRERDPDAHLPEIFLPLIDRP